MRSVDRWLSVIILILCCILYVITLSYPNEVVTFPKVLIIIMAFMSISLFLNSFRQIEKSILDESVSTWEVIITIALIILYVVLVPVIGFFMSTILYLYVQMWILNRNRIILYAVISTGTIAFLYLVFVIFLKIWFPKGLAL